MLRSSAWALCITAACTAMLFVGRPFVWLLGVALLSLFVILPRFNQDPRLTLTRAHTFHYNRW